MTTFTTVTVSDKTKFILNDGLSVKIFKKKDCVFSGSMVSWFNHSFNQSMIPRLTLGGDKNTSRVASGREPGVKRLQIKHARE